MMVFTLAVSIVLILFGHKRKSSHNLKLRISIWSAYMTADSLVIVAIGIRSSALREVYERNDGHLNDNDKLLAFWAPMLLLLLGGPDTITSYSLEDNELWLRHCLRLAAQTSATAYIIFMAWTRSYLSYLKSVIALVGIVKYGERVCALWMASNEKLKQSILANDKLKQSMLALPEPSPNYPRFPEYALQKAEGYIIAVNKLIEIEEPEGISSAMIDREHIVKAYDLLRMFRCLFVEWTLSYGERNISRSIFKDIQSEDAFRIVEIEVGFLYDLLHTKAMVLYTKWGLLLRSFTFSSTLLVLVLFSLAKKSHLSRSDLSDTYLLLAFIVFSEAYSIFKLVCSDWSNVWLCKGNKCCALRGGLVGALNFMRSIGGPRWSHSIAQFSLLSFCTKERPLVYQNVLESLRINEKLEKYHYTLHEDVSNDFRDCIFGHIKKELINMEEHLTPVPMDIHKSLTKLLKIYGLTQATWTVKGEFNQVVLTWHIVTEILYYSQSEQFKLRYSQESKLLPRYMVYLLVMYPSMLPCVIREIRLGDTSDDALKVLR
ncbi:hypothetical protein NL676_001886 [Syzygium grande]|nr:hypothetical protein NL676_001886 [Syzygium grande]